ncbi:MAG TPA: PAS domain-containing protein [Xanthobacteraceae bacterium]|nr:PAS domain-containing protein [Xanthobacteraceae bacterium]
MKTTGNRDLFEYWNKQRGPRLAPERSDIEPEAIRHVLGDTFFLAADTAGSYPFRLAGTRLCALLGRELKTESFFGLWSRTDQPTIHNLLKVVVDEKIGVVAHAIGRTIEGVHAINLELLLLPLLQRAPLDARVLGALVPHNVPCWIGARFIGPLTLGAFRHVGSRLEQPPVFRPLAPKAAAHVRQNQDLRRRFVVYEGGRTD